MIPITKPYLDNEEKEMMVKTLDSGWLVQGKQVAAFEEAIAEHEKVKYCVATTSCTSALHLTMLASGMGQGKDVFVPSFTFVATANAVSSTGATPIITDVCLDTFNIDPTSVEGKILSDYIKRDGRLINKKTGNELWGMVPVHQFGLCADMRAINSIAQKYCLKVIEDAACALGSMIDDIHIGGFGNSACVSFHPRKSITTGEGGMILTNDDSIYEKVIELRNHGSAVNSAERHAGNGSLLPSYVECGYNYRMNDIQGALGVAQSKKLDFILKTRIEKASIYTDMLSNVNDLVSTPYVPTGYKHTYQSYVCRLNFSDEAEICREKRNEVMNRLGEMGIATRQGTHAVHMLDYYRKKYNFSSSDIPTADMCDACSISLPLFVDITLEEQKFVADRLLNLVDELR